MSLRGASEPPGTPAADPALGFLARALDPLEMEPRLAALLREPGAAAPRVTLEDARVVRHKPGRRALVDYSLRIEPPPGRGARLRLLGKCRARGTDWRTFRAVRALRAAGLDGREGVEVPRAVGVVPELRMWLQERAPGATAWEGLAGDRGEALARRIAEALARLHAAPVEPPRHHAIADELRILDERLRAVARLRPAWAARLGRLAEACRRRAADAPASEPRGIHRDFHPDQVIVSSACLALVDLDLYCAGDPALDAGNFVAHLCERGLRVRGDPGALERCAGALADRFLALAGGWRAEAVQAWADLSLARQIWISTLHPERRRFTGALLELCEDRLDLASRPPSRRPAPAHSR